MGRRSNGRPGRGLRGRGMGRADRPSIRSLLAVRPSEPPPGRATRGSTAPGDELGLDCHRGHHPGPVGRPPAPACAPHEPRRRLGCVRLTARRGGRSGPDRAHAGPPTDGSDRMASPRGRRVGRRGRAGPTDRPHRPGRGRRGWSRHRRGGERVDGRAEAAAPHPAVERRPHREAPGADAPRLVRGSRFRDRRPDAVASPRSNQPGQVPASGRPPAGGQRSLVRGLRRRSQARPDELRVRAWIVPGPPSGKRRLRRGGQGLRIRAGPDGREGRRVQLRRSGRRRSQADERRSATRLDRRRHPCSLPVARDGVAGGSGRGPEHRQPAGGPMGRSVHERR